MEQHVERQIFSGHLRSWSSWSTPPGLPWRCNWRLRSAPPKH